MSDFTIKDSGERQEYPSGMRRDTQEGKVDYTLIRDGVMYERWAAHMTKGADKYGRRNWTLAKSSEELDRFRASAARHFEQWMRGDSDEDHAAAVLFNVDAAETVRKRLEELAEPRFTFTREFVPLPTFTGPTYRYSFSGTTGQLLRKDVETVTENPYKDGLIPVKTFDQGWGFRKGYKQGCCGDSGDCACNK